MIKYPSLTKSPPFTLKNICGNCYNTEKQNTLAALSKKTKPDSIQKKLCKSGKNIIYGKKAVIDIQSHHQDINKAVLQKRL